MSTKGLERDNTSTSRAARLRPRAVSPRGTIRWEQVSETHWTVFSAGRWVGSVARVGPKEFDQELPCAFIATNQVSDVLGTFGTLPEAQGAIEAPDVSDGDLIRRRKSRQLHRQDLARLLLVAVLAVLALAVAVVTYVLLTHIGR